MDRTPFEARALSSDRTPAHPRSALSRTNYWMGSMIRRGMKNGIVPCGNPPREILCEELLEPIRISQYRLTKDISVLTRRINEIVQARGGSRRTPPCGSPDTSGCRSGSASTSRRNYDIDIERDRIGRRLAREVVQRDS